MKENRGQHRENQCLILEERLECLIRPATFVKACAGCRNAGTEIDDAGPKVGLGVVASLRHICILIGRRWREKVFCFLLLAAFCDEYISLCRRLVDCVEIEASRLWSCC